MVRVKIEEIIDYLDFDIRNALQETIKKHFPGQSFNEREVFRTFVRMVGRKCNTWENVPDQCIDQ